MGERPYELIVAKWPAPEAKVDTAAKAEIDWLIELVSEVRAMRAELNIPWSATLSRMSSAATRAWSSGSPAKPRSLARMAKLGPPRRRRCGRPKARRRSASAASTYRLPARPSDRPRRRASRACRKAVAAAEKDRDCLAARLANPAFTERAKPEAVEKARADHAERAAEAERLAAALARLGSVIPA